MPAPWYEDAQNLKSKPLLVGDQQQRAKIKAHELLIREFTFPARRRLYLPEILIQYTKHQSVSVGETPTDREHAHSGQ
jgi:hypothetical protein